VIYELHVGTFTERGTFEAAIDKLDHLVQLGITHVELTNTMLDEFLKTDTLAAARRVVTDLGLTPVHGAIGVTMEYPLQRFTRRLWEWEADDGTAARWARQLGADATDGELRTWQLITGTY